jgi:AraC-like DNA-binding protein
MIRFGSMSITLLAGFLYGLLFANLLWWSKSNTRANRFLALLLVVIALRLFPYIIGYAGYYDAYPWLSFLPYDASLAFGPLLYFYVQHLWLPPALKQRQCLWHFAPVALQLAYYCVIFPQSLAFKNQWDDNVHVPFVVPLEQAATLLSIATYWLLSFFRYRQYQTWLVHHVSDREDHHIAWVRNFLIAFALTFAMWLALSLIKRVAGKLDYFQRFPFYLWLTVLAYYLGTEGYRNAAHRYPQEVAASNAPNQQSEQATEARQTDPAAGTATVIVDVAKEILHETPKALTTADEQRSLQTKAVAWRARLIEQEWWRDPELSLEKLARLLGTNTSDLSRVINEGLALNFNELINRLRVDAVKTAIEANAKQVSPPASLLDIAFEAGFSSKASFNRCFKLYAGYTPTAWRQRQSNVI